MGLALAMGKGSTRSTGETRRCRCRRRWSSSVRTRMGMVAWGGRSAERGRLVLLLLAAGRCWLVLRILSISC